MARASKPEEAKPETPQADPFAMPQMGDPAAMVEGFRAIAEDNLEKSRTALEKARAVYEDVQKEAEAGFSTARAQSSRISLAAIDTLRDNTEKTFGQLERLMKVKTVAELVEFQAAFLRQQAEMTVDTAKTMQSLYRQASEEMSGPAKAAAEKAMSAFKAE